MSRSFSIKIANVKFVMDKLNNIYHQDNKC